MDDLNLFVEKSVLPDNEENFGDGYWQAVKTAADKELYLRNRFLAGLCAGALCAGLIFPAISGLMDILWVLSLSFCTVVVFMCISAKKITDVTALPMLFVASICLRFMILINSAKYVLKDSSPSIVQTIFAKVFITESGFTIIVILAAAFVVLGVVIKTANVIENKSGAFTLEILPLKKSVIDSRNNIGTLSDERSERLVDDLAVEGKFYFSMMSIAKVFKGEVIAGAMVVFVVGIVSGTLSVLQEEFSSYYYAKAAGTAGVYLLQSLVMAVGTAFLTRRLFMGSSQFDISGYDDVEKTEDQVEEPRLLNPNFNDVPKKSVADETELKDTEVKDAEFEVEKDGFENLRKWTDRHYQKMADTLTRIGDDRAKVALLGSDSHLNLPVNIPVNLAIRLAGADRKCLLVDMDKTRNAIEKVFADDGTMDQKSENSCYQTCINNVWIYRGTDIEQLKIAIENFSNVVIYAPNIEQVIEDKGLLGQVRSAILFSGDRYVMEEARDEFKELGITIINIKK